MTPSSQPEPVRPPGVAQQFLQFWLGRQPWRPTGRPRVWWYLTLWWTALGAGLAVAVMGSIIAALAGSHPNKNAVADLVTTSSAPKVVLLAVVIAPLWEETAFRLPVSATPWTTALGCSVLLLVVGPGVMNLSPTWFLGRGTAQWVRVGVGAGEVIIAFALLWAVFAAVRRRRPGRSTEVGSANHRWRLVAMAGLTVGFAAAHLANFAHITSLTPVMVVPQLLLGSVLMFARVNLSWWAGVAIHAANNLVSVGAALAVRNGGAASVLGGLVFLGFIALTTIGSVTALVWNAIEPTRDTPAPAPTGGPTYPGSPPEMGGPEGAAQTWGR